MVAAIGYGSASSHMGLGGPMGLVPWLWVAWRRLAAKTDWHHDGAADDGLGGGGKYPHMAVLAWQLWPWTVCQPTSLGAVCWREGCWLGLNKGGLTLLIFLRQVTDLLDAFCSISSPTYSDLCVRDL
jgi:hypothetical protein